ncbi:hypothetical protein NCC49_005089 [Naganishia albida]|nr:hypothetical protein NCC49_005089 [Naganishia albida]
MQLRSDSDFNIIEQAFQAAIAASNPGLPGVVHLDLTADPNSHPPADRPPQSPSTETVSSRSSGASRHRFRSYNGPALPEIETPSSHADLFYLAFGNGGSSSRQSLTGKTVKKKRERAEEDKAEREQRALEKAEKEERRKQPHDDNFERSVNDDSTTESQTESVTESAHTSSTMEQSNMQESKENIAELAEERRRKRREAKKKDRKDGNSSSPEPIVPAAVILPITGMTILTKDGRPLTNDPKDSTAIALQRAEPDGSSFQQSHAKRPSLSSGSRSTTKTPKVRNVGGVLKPQGSFTTARRPNMTIDADAIRAKALASDDRFDTINIDQLQAAADAGDQIAEAHLRQRNRWQQLRQDQGALVIPSDREPNAPPVRRRNTVATASSRRRSSTQAEREVSKDIQTQVEQMESRRSSGSTTSSGRLSTTSLGSAVEALMDTSGDRDNPFDLPIKLSSLSSRSGSTDLTRVGSEGYSTGQPKAPNDTQGRRPSAFISNPMFSSKQDFFNVPAFPPVTSPSPVSPTIAASGTPSRKGSAVAMPSPAREPELFMDVARMTSRQVEKDRALHRAQDARNKGLATESSATRAARKSSDRRLRVDEANSVLAEADAKAKAGHVVPDIVSAMSSFGFSYGNNRRPSVDNTVDPLQGNDAQEQRRAERQRKKRMLRQLEHERVIRETPMEEYSNPMDTYLGKASMSENRETMPQLSESNDEQEEERTSKTITAIDTGHIPPPSGKPSGEG